MIDVIDLTPTATPQDAADQGYLVRRWQRDVGNAPRVYNAYYHHVTKADFPLIEVRARGPRSKTVYVGLDCFHCTYRLGEHFQTRARQLFLEHGCFDRGYNMIITRIDACHYRVPAWAAGIIADGLVQLAKQPWLFEPIEDFKQSDARDLTVELDRWLIHERHANR